MDGKDLFLATETSPYGKDCFVTSNSPFIWETAHWEEITEILLKYGNAWEEREKAEKAEKAPRPSEHLAALRRQGHDVNSRLEYLGSVVDMLCCRMDKLDPIPIAIQPPPKPGEVIKDSALSAAAATGYQKWCTLIDEIKRFIERHKFREPKTLWLDTFRSGTIRDYLAEEYGIPPEQVINILGYQTHWDADQNKIE
jgi:hypothetical protein